MAKKTKKQIEKDEQIYQLTTLVAGEFSLQEVLDKLAEAAVRIVGVKACSIRLLDEQAGELKMRSTYGLSEAYRNKGPVTKDDTVIKDAFKGEAVVLDNMRLDNRVKYKEATIKEGLVSQLTVAMKFRNKPIGVLRLYSPRPRRFYQDDISLARSVASQCAVAITNAKLYAEAIEAARLTEQMRLAGVIQRRMIPQQPPSVRGLDVAAAYVPCFDVGGDFYDFIRLGDDCFAVAIADVIGKGIPAAIMMSLFRGTIRAYANTDAGAAAVETIIEKLNRMACNECQNGEFITLFYAIINAGTGTITYCNCGHEPALLLRDKTVTPFQTGGLVLGIDPSARYETETAELRSGDCVLFFTDGLTDAVNFDGRSWGRENLLKAVKKFISVPSAQMVKDILGYRRRYVGLARQVDDTTVVVVKIGDDFRR